MDAPAVGAVASLGARPDVGGRDLELPGGPGVTLAATAWEGTGPLVVLHHGLASQRWFWAPVVRRLPGVRLLAVDARGHGDSSTPDEGYDLPSVAGDLATALAAYGEGPAVVVGHSWGASVALGLAAGLPDLVTSLVALDGGFAGLRVDEPREEVKARLAPPRLSLPPEDLRAMLAGRAEDWWGPESLEAVLPIFGVGGDGLARARLTFDRHMAVLDGMLDSDPVALWQHVRCPAWVVSCSPAAGAGDWAARREEGLQAVSAVRRDARVLRWEGAVHDVPLQWPDLVAGLIRTAVAEVTAAAARRAPAQDQR